MLEGCVGLASCSWRIWGIEISFKLEIDPSFHVWGLSCDEGASCSAGFLISSPLGLTAATLALGLEDPVLNCPSTSFPYFCGSLDVSYVVFAFHTPKALRFPPLNTFIPSRILLKSDKTKRMCSRVWGVNMLIFTLWATAGGCEMSLVWVVESRSAVSIGLN